MLSVLASAESMVEQINSEEVWDWANNQANKGKLETKIKEVKSKLTADLKNFLTEDMIEIKKRTKGDEVQSRQMCSDMRSFLGLKPDVEALEKQRMKLAMRHRC